MTQTSATQTKSRTRHAEAKANRALHRDVYPVVRISTEFFLRSLELIVLLKENIVDCLIIMRLWHDALRYGDKLVSIREISRQLDYPFETVRRHVRRLVRSGVCVVEDDGMILSPTIRQGDRMTDILRKIYVHALRMLGDLKRIGVLSYKPRRSKSASSRHLDKEQAAIALASLKVLLAAMKVLRRFFDGDLVTGLVFTAIRAANVKHITNTAPAANRGILPDSDRLPVSMMAISDSMGLPYATVLRHARKLVREGKCVRIGRKGLIAPEVAFRQMTVESDTVRQLVLAFLADLRAAGVNL